jgi:uncharacterized protein YlxW (UPF0749 family)
VTQRPLDASMTLLREVMERPLDPSYAAAAAHGRRPAGRVGTAVTLVLAVVAGAAFSISVVSIRSPQRESSAVDARLRDELKQRTAAVEAREASIAALRAQIVLAQKSALGSSGAPLATRIDELGTITGQNAVTGPGLEFTIDDAPASEAAVGGDPRADQAYDEGRVLDADLQTVVNGLWAAGAEAIAINGQRLTALSAIRTAGQAILVDFRPLSRPYHVQAIGASSALQAGFASGPAGPYVQSMRDNSGIRVDISTQDRMTLPGSGQLVLRRATPTSTPEDAP